ncbi:hypothetical protein [Bradyrhizobium sp. Ai1a-2]|uniref:hypothetical protein n=1 Tax=Bradyrhizobium sp. Ai1a-2 TaxID=196490 RepID=UPI0003F6E4D2|nr:hypothetical protein [Bradyrhizobium sp. Ai1a-2]
MPEQENPSRDIKPSDDYVTRLMKLLPAEITGAYLAIRLVSSPESNSHDKWIALFAAIIFCIAPFFMYFVLKMRQTKQIIFLTLSYVVWISNFEIDRIKRSSEQIAELSEKLVRPFGDALVLMTDPTFIKGIAVLWLLLLSPFVFAKEAMAPEQPQAVEPPKEPEQ